MKIKMQRRQIGYVAAIKYDSEGNLMEWLYGTKGELCGYDDNCKLFKTYKSAKKFINSKQHNGIPYVRKYYYTTYI